MVNDQKNNWIQDLDGSILHVSRHKKQFTPLNKPQQTDHCFAAFQENSFFLSPSVTSDKLEPKFTWVFLNFLPAFFQNIYTTVTPMFCQVLLHLSLFDSWEMNYWTLQISTWTRLTWLSGCWGLEPWTLPSGYHQDKFNNHLITMVVHQWICHDSWQKISYSWSQSWWFIHLQPKAVIVWCWNSLNSKPWEK